VPCSVPRRGRAWLLALGLFLFGCGDGAQRPHIVLVTADALRADHLSSAGYPRATSPALDAFAARAWNFRNTVSVIPKTGPSFASLFSGQHPARHGVRSNPVPVPRELRLLAERLQDVGYRTAAFVSNPVLRPAKGYARGFETYELSTGADATQQAADAFVQYAASGWREPTFVWVHLLDPHGPYRPTTRFEQLFLEDSTARSDERVPLEPPPGRFRDPNKVLHAIPAYQRRGQEDRVAAYVARYDAEIRAMDEQFGRITQVLSAQDRFESSVVIFTSDHGEGLGERGFWFEHGWFANDAALRVPLFLKTPGQVVGHEIDEQASLLDLLPTLLGLAGSEVPIDLSGRNLLEPGFAPVPLPIENSDLYPEKYRGIRTTRWKYLRREHDGAEELFDLREDPEERHDLSRTHPAELEKFRVLLRETSVDSRRSGEAVDPESDAIREQLRALGYLD